MEPITQTVNIERIAPRNKRVMRVFAQDGFTIDLPNECIELTAEDRIKVELSGAQTMKAECVLRGYVYELAGDYSFVSCGGLLVKVRAVLNEGATVLIGVTKSRRRRRS